MKTVGFSLAAVVLFFALLEGVLAVTGVAPGARQTDPFLGFAGRLPLFRPSPEDPAVLATAPNRRSYFNEQRFPREKADGVTRIFCVGGSTTFGRPGNDGTSFCGWLREMLPACDPSRKWELVNAGGIGYASYRVVIVMEELATYDPDLFIVYTGHNEFLERRTYGDLLEAPRALREAAATLDRTRTYTALRRLLGRNTRDPARTVLPAEVDALLDRSIGPDDYARDDVQRRRTLDHFRYNLERMTDIARAAGAGIVFVTPASNVRDCVPFKSQRGPDGSGGESRRWREAIQRAAAASAAGDITAETDALEEATGGDPRHAETWFRLGGLLSDAGRPAEARTAFRRALEEDVCPLRAPPELISIVRSVATERNIPLYDWVAEAEALSPGGVPGNGLFVDHVHPSPEAHGRIADGLLEILIRTGRAQPGPAWTPGVREQISVAVAGRVDPEAHAQSLVNLARVVGWSGKVDEAYRHAAEAIALDPHHAEGQALAAAYAYRLGRIDEACRHAEAALTERPEDARTRGVLGLALLAQGRPEEALAHHRRSVEIDPESAEVRNNYAYALLRTGRLNAAITQSTEALRLRPTFPEAFNNRGIARAQGGRMEEAMRDFRAALELRPGYAQAHNNLGLALAGGGRLQEAAAHFEAALAADPAYSEAEHNLAAAQAAVR